jgi:hypothetical protein
MLIWERATEDLHSPQTEFFMCGTSTDNTWSGETASAFPNLDPSGAHHRFKLFT